MGGLSTGSTTSPGTPGTEPVEGPTSPPTPPGPRGETPSPFTCVPQPAPELPLRRLSRDEYRNAVEDFVRAALPMAATSVVSAVQPTLEQVPTDARVAAPGDTHGGFTRLDQTVQQPAVDASWATAVAVANQLTRPSARLGQLLGACATDADAGNDAACLRALVDRLAPLAHRAPLRPGEADFYVQTAGATPVAPDAVADVLTLMLGSPGFLYHLESGTGPGPDGTVTLDAFELAARLSFHFWQRPPDDELRARAADGSLSSEAVYRQQVDRLVRDPRAAPVR